MSKPSDDAGFTICLDVFSAKEVGQLVDALADAPHRSRAGNRHPLAHPAVAAVVKDPRLLDLARGLLGGDSHPFRATLFDKSPKANWLVVWHQDTALPLRRRKDVPGWGPWSIKAGILHAHAPAAALAEVVALRLHLDDSYAENGPLRVLPGTHTLGVLSDEAIANLARRVAPQACLAPRGGVVSMRPLLIHASSKAAVPQPRRVLHIEYARSLTMEAGLTLAEA